MKTKRLKIFEMTQTDEEKEKKQLLELRGQVRQLKTASAQESSTASLIFKILWVRLLN